MGDLLHGCAANLSNSFDADANGFSSANLYKDKKDKKNLLDENFTANMLAEKANLSPGVGKSGSSSSSTNTKVPTPTAVAKSADAGDVTSKPGGLLGGLSAALDKQQAEFAEVLSFLK